MQHKKLMGIVALLMCLTLVAPTVTIEAATTIYNNQTGTQDGYNYELWKDYGTTSMTLNGGGTFSCQWSNIGNALFRKGKKFDATKTYSQLGNITIDYGCNYQPNGNSYLCVYGWSKSPACGILHRRQLGNLASTGRNFQRTDLRRWRNV